MAKQKGGLGRGLNALFSEAEPTPAKQQKNEENQPKSEAQNLLKTENPISVPPKPTDAPEANSVNNVSTKAQNAPQNQSSDIYFSEDDLQNAKVVSREPTRRTTTEQKKSTASLREEKIQAQCSVQQRSAAPVKSAGAGRTAATSPLQPPKVSVLSSIKEDKKDDKGTVGEVPLNMVEPNPDQPRTHFKKEEIEELANSIKKEGLLQPILVRKVGQRYQIIAGERRWQACKSLGMEKIPVRFWLADSDKALEIALIENIQRSDLNPIEEAYGYKRLMERRNMTQSEVAQTVSKGRSTIANALRLLDLPEEAQQLLFEEKITAGHARAILSIPTAEGRKTLTNKLMNEKLSVRETEAIARLLAGRENAKNEGKTKRVPSPASFKKAARGLTKFLSTPVRVKTVQGKNKIEIQFKDEEELQRIVEAISKAE